MDSPSVSATTLHHQKCSKLLLDISVLLVSSGAHTERVNRNLCRIAKALGYEIQLFFSLSGITLTLTDLKTSIEHTAFRRIEHYGINMSVVSAISRMSWKIAEESLSLGNIHQEVRRIKTIAHYPDFQVIGMMSLAGMAFCRLAGGEWPAMLLAGLATAAGFITRKTMLTRRYNLPLTISTASFVASSISGLGLVFNIGQFPEVAVATSVLFLIPGIPMINGVIDLMHGHIIVGQARLMQGMVIAFSIALGIIISSALLGVNQL